MKRLSLFVLLALASTGAMAQSRSYQIDPTHTDVIATWSHFGFSNPSLHAGEAKGTIVFDEKNIGASKVVVELPLAGFETHVSKLNEHLAGGDFLDAAKFPTARFESVHVQDLGGGKFDIHGKLTVHGVSKPLTLHAKLNKAGIHPMSKQQTVGFGATGSLLRSDYGVGAFAPAVSDKIELRITTEASETPAK